MKDLILIGAGYHSRCVIELIEEMNALGKTSYNILGFLDDNRAIHDKKIIDYPVLGNIDSAKDFPKAHFINGIYSLRNQTKISDIIQRTGAKPDRWPTIIHPTAWISPRVKIGRGVFIYPSVKVFNETRLSDLVMIMPGALIGVAVSIGYGVSISANAVIGGDTIIGKSVYVGQGSCVQEGVRIGDEAIIAMGAKVRKDVPQRSLVVDDSPHMLDGTMLRNSSEMRRGV